MGRDWTFRSSVFPRHLRTRMRHIDCRESGFLWKFSSQSEISFWLTCWGWSRGTIRTPGIVWMPDRNNIFISSMLLLKSTKELTLNNNFYGLNICMYICICSHTSIIIWLLKLNGKYIFELFDIHNIILLPRGIIMPY